MQTEKNKIKPLVSILMVNYNYGRFIATAIESALAQSYSNVEVIVVDDGSTDSSREVIDRYKGRVRAIYKQNGGQLSATNTAFEASAGDIICLLDSDDYFLPDKVSKIVACYQHHEGAVYVFHALRRIDGNGAEIGINEPMNGSRWLDSKVKRFMLPPHDGTDVSSLCLEYVKADARRIDHFWRQLLQIRNHGTCPRVLSGRTTGGNEASWG